MQIGIWVFLNWDLPTCSKSALSEGGAGFTLNHVSGKGKWGVGTVRREVSFPMERFAETDMHFAPCGVVGTDQQLPSISAYSPSALCTKIGNPPLPALPVPCNRVWASTVLQSYNHPSQEATCPAFQPSPEELNSPNSGETSTHTFPVQHDEALRSQGAGAGKMAQSVSACRTNTRV